ncbi:acyl-CoA thioesterase [Kordiimonas sediminis]|uniref:Acyl-CoA thioesterase n=1 Tax=Kordiimonas sediminis TaxID=1735581 RepID=A0A919AZD5_9PROT|nr:acyl-CoA thioesterase [Kordiimonas sediminis]GHF30567.1 acyl-CoA thioesterase [Kordiimonas sediminis]
MRDDVIIRTTPMPSDLNVNGNIFGGWVLSQMDIAGGVVAARIADGAVATVAIEGMKFHAPILPGDLISVYAHAEKIGRTSITVAIEVVAEARTRGADEIKVTEGKYIFVAVDKDGRPRPVPSSQKTVSI